MKIDIEKLEKAISEVLGAEFVITDYNTEHSTGKWPGDEEYLEQFGMEVAEKPFTKINLAGFLK